MRQRPDEIIQNVPSRCNEMLIGTLKTAAFLDAHHVPGEVVTTECSSPLAHTLKHACDCHVRPDRARTG